MLDLCSQWVWILSQISRVGQKVQCNLIHGPRPSEFDRGAKHQNAGTGKGRLKP